MKRENDVQLIYRILAGDNTAFNCLVEKYQKGVHALVWRKIGDFHYAEEITQDTFLRAYKNLPTLKDPNQFAGWLYVIANRLCIDWLRQQKTTMQSLEDTPVVEIDKASYAYHVSAQRQTETTEHHREIVKNLLAKLPESERTVVTLYYLGEMTTKEIGKFLGVSVDTIKSRLQRGRKRLQEWHQESLVRETLGSIPFPAHLTERIMRQVDDIGPIQPPVGKPLTPWVAFGTAVVLVVLILGVSSQHLTRFQKPYSLDARSETTVEIIDAFIVLDTQVKPDLRNQMGRFDTTSDTKGIGPQVSAPVRLGATQVNKKTLPLAEQQWIQASGPEGGAVSGLLVSVSGDVYATSPIGIYRLAPGATAWTFVSPLVSTMPPEDTGNYKIPIAEGTDTLYLVSVDEVLASTDRGRNWKTLGVRPKGNPIGFVITDDTFYLALEDKGIFQSTDIGKRWTSVNNEVADSTILAMTALGNTVFIGTNKGLYRINSGTWKKLSVDTTKSIHALAVSGNNLYVGTGSDPSQSQLETPEGRKAYIEKFISNIDSNESAWELFHSTDLGESWTDITPTSESTVMKISSPAKILAVGNDISVLGMMNFHSTDCGKTWTEFESRHNKWDMNSIMNTMTANISDTIALDEKTILTTGVFGLTRSTDGGKSWHSFVNGIVGISIFNLVGFKNEFYTSTVKGIAKSTDGGESWMYLPTDSGGLSLKPTEKTNTANLMIFPRLAIADGVLYGIASDMIVGNKFHIFRLSTSGNVLVPIQETPAYGEVSSITNIIELADITRQLQKFPGAFAVSGEIFYVEYMRQLLRWKRGDSEWYNTGLIDTGKSTETNPNDDLENTMKGFKLAVSQETVYVGKRDGTLFQSFDRGTTWKDITSNLRLRFERFNQITFAGSTVYVATNVGVLTSEDHEQWHVITDAAGMYVPMDRMTVDASTVYGAGDKGVYQLDHHGEWQQISPKVPDTVISLVIDGDMLYIATQRRGMFYVSLTN